MWTKFKNLFKPKPKSRAFWNAYFDRFIQPQVEELRRLGVSEPAIDVLVKTAIDNADPFGVFTTPGALLEKEVARIKQEQA